MPVTCFWPAPDVHKPVRIYHVVNHTGKHGLSDRLPTARPCCPYKASSRQSVSPASCCHLRNCNAWCAFRHNGLSLPGFRNHIYPLSAFLDMIYFLIAQTVFQSYVFINLAPAYRTAEEKDSKKKNSFKAQISFHIILHIQKRFANL